MVVRSDYSRFSLDLMASKKSSYFMDPLSFLPKFTVLIQCTAGLGYSFSNAKLKRWYDPVGVIEDTNEENDIFG